MQRTTRNGRRSMSMRPCRWGPKSPQHARSEKKNWRNRRNSQRRQLLFPHPEQVSRLGGKCELDALVRGPECCNSKQERGGERGGRHSFSPPRFLSQARYCRYLRLEIAPCPSFTTIV